MTPVLEPYSHGSITLLLNNSRTMKRESVNTGAVHDGATVKEINTGNDAAIHGPTYGMNRSTVDNVPHKMAFGTPMKYSPIAMGIP